MDLLDSNILLRYVRRSLVADGIERRYTLTTAEPAPIISIVSEGELRALGLQFAWGPVRLQAMEELPGYFTVIPLPFEDIVEVYAEIDDFSRRKGAAMGKNEIWIAATAHVTGARLLTTDRDFDRLHTVYLQRDWVDPTAV